MGKGMAGKKAELNIQMASLEALSKPKQGKKNTKTKDKVLSELAKMRQILEIMQKQVTPKQAEVPTQTLYADFTKTCDMVTETSVLLEDLCNETRQNEVLSQALQLLYAGADLIRVGYEVPEGHENTRLIQKTKNHDKKKAAFDEVFQHSRKALIDIRKKRLQQAREQANALNLKDNHSAVKALNEAENILDERLLNSEAQAFQTILKQFDQSLEEANKKTPPPTKPKPTTPMNVTQELAMPPPPTQDTEEDDFSHLPPPMDGPETTQTTIPLETDTLSDTYMEVAPITTNPAPKELHFHNPPSSTSQASDNNDHLFEGLTALLQASRESAKAIHADNQASQDNLVNCFSKHGLIDTQDIRQTEGTESFTNTYGTHIERHNDTGALTLTQNKKDKTSLEWMAHTTALLELERWLQGEVSTISFKLSGKSEDQTTMKQQIEKSLKEHHPHFVNQTQKKLKVSITCNQEITQKTFQPMKRSQMNPRN